jgi:hypothetical protein
MLEKDIRKKIVTGLKEKYPSSLWYKIHGGPMQEKGISDILGCVKGIFVAIEVKRPAPDYSEPTPYQKMQLTAVRKAGGISGVATSLKEALILVDNGLKLRNK